MSTGEFPEILGQRILVGIIVVAAVLEKQEPPVKIGLSLLPFYYYYDYYYYINICFRGAAPQPRPGPAARGRLVPEARRRLRHQGKFETDPKDQIRLKIILRLTLPNLVNSKIRFSRSSSATPSSGNNNPEQPAFQTITTP